LASDARRTLVASLRAWHRVRAHRRTRCRCVRGTWGRRLAPPTLLGRAFADGDLDIHVLVVAPQPYRSRLSRAEGRHQVQPRVRILDRLALDRNQDIAGSSEERRVGKESVTRWRRDV